MLRFECDWCNRLKQEDETWILGYAAENVGVTAARREVAVLSSWDRERAVHPFAVHFCSAKHKDNYLAALFENGIEPERRRSARKVTRTAKKTAAVHRRRAS